MSREAKLVKNTLILSVGTLLPRIVTFITLPILTGCLTKYEYGVYDLITVLVSLYLPAVTLQVQTAAFRFIIDDKNDKDKIEAIVTNILCFTLAISLLALVVLYFVLFNYSSTVRILICIYFMLDIISGTLSQIARGLSLNLCYSIGSLIKSLLQMAFLVILVWRKGLGLVGALISLIISVGINCIFVFASAHIGSFLRLKELSSDTLKKMILYSWPMVPNNMSMWIMRVSDRLIVSAVLGAQVNAVYAVANKIPTLLSQVQSTFTMAWQENASIYSEDNDVSLYYSNMFEIIVRFMAGTTALLVAFAPIIFKILIRGDYADAFVHMNIIFVATFFSCLSSYVGGIYVAYKATKKIGITTAIAAVCNIIVNISMIFWAGLFAASISTLVSYVALFLYRIQDVRKIVHLCYNKKLIVTCTLVICVQCLLGAYRNLILDILNLIIGCIFFFVANRKLIYTFTMKTKKILHFRNGTDR